MQVVQLKFLKGAERYGTCNECGIGSDKEKEMKKIKFNDTSVCLCKKCFFRLWWNVGQVFLREFEKEEEKQC